jgi:DNA-binding GntR family transcriptional regulator
MASNTSHGEALPVQAVKRHRPIRDQVADSLRDAIVNMTFSPGQRLIEGDLCEMLGTSRASLRQALRVLETEGLVHAENGRGIYVSTLEPKEAADLYVVRANLEGLLARLFVEQATTEDLKEAARLVKAMETALHSPKPNADLIRGSSLLYALMFRVVGNKTLEQYITLIHRRTPQVRAATLKHPGRGAQAASELKAFADAALLRDSALASAAMTTHVLQAGEVAAQVANPAGRP